MATKEEKEFVYEETKDITVPPLPRGKGSLQTKRSRIYWINRLIDAYNEAVRRHAKANLYQYILYYLASSYYGTGLGHRIHPTVRPFIEASIEAYKKYLKKNAGPDIFHFFGKCEMCGKEKDLGAGGLCEKCHERWESFRGKCEEKEKENCKAQKGLLCEYRSCPSVKAGSYYGTGKE